MLARKAFYHLSHSARPFFVGYFEDRVSGTTYPGWFQIKSLLLSAFQVARIIGMSYWHPVILSFLNVNTNCYVNNNWGI
jgi:hypothetical protein